MNVLFLCSQNKLRSPTAEQVFAKWPGIEVSSAGLDDTCGNPVTPEDLQWANLVLVMEQAHRNKLSRRFKPHLKHARVIVLGIPDDYEFMDPELIRILEAKVPPFLRR